MPLAQPAQRFVDSVRIARSFKSQAERLGARVEHDPDARQWRAQKGNRLLIVEEDSRLAWVDGVLVFLDMPLTLQKGRWALGASDEALILQSVFADAVDDDRSVKTIAIDPGHGGADDGTRNGQLSLLEKEVNLDVSQRLKTHLEKRGYKTVMTRYDDRAVALDERSNIANKSRADLFVSVHFNAAENQEAQGLETYILTPAGQLSTSGDPGAGETYGGNRFDQRSFELAYRVQKELVGRLQRMDRGVKKGRFEVLRNLNCPGVLVEAGFLSHEGDALLASTAAYRERVAQALAEAIDAYANRAPLGEL